MKYHNWKSFLSKNIFIVFLAMGILALKLFYTYANDVVANETKIGYVLNAFVFGYGILLILIYLIINRKYIYLLNYGLVYSILGCLFMFISPLVEYYFDLYHLDFNLFSKFIPSFNESYFELIIIIGTILDGLFKIIFNKTHNKILKLSEIIIGSLLVVVGGMLLIGDILLMKEISINSFVSAIFDKIIYIWFILIILDFILFTFNVIEDITHIKEEISNHFIESKASLRDNNDVDENHSKRKINTSEVEVIDLERFFKEEK